VGHHITALILAVPVDASAARGWDAVPVALAGGLTLVHVTHYYTAYWQATRGVTAELDVPAEFPPIFPRESVVELLAADLAGEPDPDYALVMTDYFGGAGGQWACGRTGGRFGPASDINEALRALGVRAGAGQDEFDTVGLVAHRMSPEYLDRYEDLCEELGI
jgi:hypothetical protein